MSEDYPTTPGKPSKPYPDFPLFPHATGRWVKKIRGKMHYFGPWADPDAALAKYLEQKDALHAGRKLRPETDALTIRALANAFLNHKQAILEAGELSPRMWADYKTAADELIAHLAKQRLIADLDPADFAELRNKMAKKGGPVTLGNVIPHIRSLFNYADDAGLIDRPMRFGPGFARPSKKTLRLERARKGPRMFEAAWLEIAVLGQGCAGPRSGGRGTMIGDRGRSVVSHRLPLAPQLQFPAAEGVGIPGRAKLPWCEVRSQRV
jgi:hypothetical protein